MSSFLASLFSSSKGPALVAAITAVELADLTTIPGLGAGVIVFIAAMRWMWSAFKDSSAEYRQLVEDLKDDRQANRLEIDRLRGIIKELETPTPQEGT